MAVVETEVYVIPAYPGPYLVAFAAEKLGALRDDVVFVGGAAAAFLITDPAASDLRATSDVDVIIETGTLGDYYALEERLRELGFVNDSREDAPRCRWLKEHVVVDVMPTDVSIMGFSNRWYAEALCHAMPYELDNGMTIRLVTAPYFLATKIEAFHGRGEGDFRGSHDMEDIVALIDGRPEIVAEVDACDKGLREYLKSEFTGFLQNGAFREALYGHLQPDPVSQERMPFIVERIEAMVGKRRRP